MFGTGHKFSDHTYDAIGFSPRSFNSFEEDAVEAGLSRVYGGLHYRSTITATQLQGKKLAQNIGSQVKLKK